MYFSTGRFLGLNILGLVMLTGCSGYTPLNEKALRIVDEKEKGCPLSATFLGNSTIYLTDGDTGILVDGFLSRPGKFDSFVGKVKPDWGEISRQLERVGITKIDAVLVGHTHADHALDAPTISKMTGAKVMGSKSYQYVHKSYGASEDTLIVVSNSGGFSNFGKFKVTFVPSDHIESNNFMQRRIEGKITKPFMIPAEFTDFKCGEIFAIHIEHPNGNVALTTSVGANFRQWGTLSADVLFLSIGLGGCLQQVKLEKYWNWAVESLNPHTVIPVHWDDFSRKLDKPLKSPPPILDRPKRTMEFLKSKAGSHTKIRVMDRFETLKID